MHAFFFFDADDTRHGIVRVRGRGRRSLTAKPPLQALQGGDMEIDGGGWDGVCCGSSTRSAAEPVPLGHISGAGSVIIVNR